MKDGSFIQRFKKLVSKFSSHMEKMVKEVFVYAYGLFYRTCNDT